MLKVAETQEKLKPRVLKRYVYSHSNARQILVMYLDGVLASRDPNDGRFYFRDGLLEGLYMLRAKTGP